MCWNTHTQGYKKGRNCSFKFQLPCDVAVELLCEIIFRPNDLEFLNSFREKHPYHIFWSICIMCSGRLVQQSRGKPSSARARVSAMRQVVCVANQDTQLFVLPFSAQTWTWLDRIGLPQELDHYILYHHTPFIIWSFHVGSSFVPYLTKVWLLYGHFLLIQWPMGSPGDQCNAINSIWCKQ